VRRWEVGAGGGEGAFCYASSVLRVERIFDPIAACNVLQRIHQRSPVEFEAAGV